MDSFIHALADLISRHDAWAALVLGVITFLESLVLMGAFVPATALMVMAGGLVAAGVLEPLPVLFACMLGAVLGDSVSFAIGRRLGPGALRHPLFRKQRRGVARTRLFMRRYGVASIFVGRFFGPLRAFVPVMAGMLGMGQRTFQVANIASAAVWVPVILAPGYFAARGLAQLEELTEGDIITLAAAGGVIVSAALWCGWRILRRRTARRAALMRA